MVEQLELTQSTPEVLEDIVNGAAEEISQTLMQNNSNNQASKQYWILKEVFKRSKNGEIIKIRDEARAIFTIIQEEEEYTFTLTPLQFITAVILKHGAGKIGRGVTSAEYVKIYNGVISKLKDREKIRRSSNGPERSFIAKFNLPESIITQDAARHLKIGRGMTSIDQHYVSLCIIEDKNSGIRNKQNKVLTTYRLSVILDEREL